MGLFVIMHLQSYITGVEQFMNQYFFLPGDDFSFSEFGCFILPTTRGLSMLQIQWCEKPLLLPTVSTKEGVLEI